MYTLEQRGEVGLQSTYRRCRFWQKKKSYLQVKLILILAGNPLAYSEKPTHPKQITVWRGFWFRGIIGPFFFENEQGEAVTLNGDRYRAMLNEFCLQKLKRRILATFGVNRTALRATQPSRKHRE